MCSQVVYQISDVMEYSLTKNGLRGYFPPVLSWTHLPGRGLILLVVVFPAVLHQVELGWFSLEVLRRKISVNFCLRDRQDSVTLWFSSTTVVWSCLRDPPVPGAFAINAKSFSATPNLYSQSSRAAWCCDTCLCMRLGVNRGISPCRAVVPCL